MSRAASRRTSTCLAVLSLAALGLSATASAAPTITSFKIAAVPIAGFAHTGNILGAGAVIQGHTSISGTEYSGSPPPLTGLEFYAPAGTRLHPQGFATCAPTVLETIGPKACPKNSTMGPGGYAVGAVSFGGERVPETVSIEPFFPPGGGGQVFVAGHTPAVIEILVKAQIIPASPPYGLEAIAEVPLIETVPGAPDASFLEGTVAFGAAFKRARRRSPT